MTNDDSTERRGHDEVGLDASNFHQQVGECAAESLRTGRILQHERALHVIGTVQAAGEQKMSAQVSASLLK